MGWRRTRVRRRQQLDDHLPGSQWYFHRAAAIYRQEHATGWWCLRSWLRALMIAKSWIEIAITGMECAAISIIEFNLSPEAWSPWRFSPRYSEYVLLPCQYRAQCQLQARTIIKTASKHISDMLWIARVCLCVNPHSQWASINLPNWTHNN